MEAQMAENGMVCNDAAGEYEKRFSDHAGDEAAARVIAAVLSGEDHVLPWCGSVNLRYPVSEFLGESSKPAQAQLLQACHLALNQHADDASVRAALAAFVNIVAADYGSNL